jgi:hypothetical protein
MISAYADYASLVPGATLQLHVSTDAPKFRVEFYRLGTELVGPLAGMANPDIRVGHNVPPAGPADDWGWPAYGFTLPAAWGTGVYVAMLVEVDANGADLPDQPLDRTTPNGKDRKAMFIIRGAHGSSRPILVKIPTATYQAYNYTGGGSIYRDNPSQLESLRRPGNGTGGVTTFSQQDTPYYQLDVYDQSSNRMDLGHLEGPFIRWLEANGYAARVDYCSDFDLHEDPTLLDPYQLMLSVGHDEYWSEPMRTRVLAFVARGGNVAFFSGNTCWKQITFVQPWQFHNDGERYYNGHPVEDSLTGVSYYHGNGRWDDWREAVGYTFQHTDHWALRDVGSATLGAYYTNQPSTLAGLIGYECDGAPTQLQDGVLVPVQGGNTPSDLLVLGTAQLDPAQWQDDGHGVNACTMAVFATGGVTFTTGTVDWARVLASGLEPRVETLTRNVLDTLAVRVPFKWSTRGAQLAGVPVIATNADGRLEPFARGYDGAIHHIWQLAPNTGWSGWASEGGQLAGDGSATARVSAARNANGRISVFARFSDGSIRVLTQIAPNSSWTQWVSIGGEVAGDPVVGINADGRLEVFVRGFDGHLYHAWQGAPGGAFSGWSDRGGTLSGHLSVARNVDGRLDVFGRDVSGAVVHIAQTAPNNGWGTWQSLGGNVAGDPVLGVNADGRLEVFVIGFDGHLYHAWQGTPGSGFSGFADRGGKLVGNPAVATNLDGRLEVFARGTDGALWHVAQTAANNGWGAFETFSGALASDPAVGCNADGRLEAFAVSVQHTLWHRWQYSPGTW